MDDEQVWITTTPKDPERAPKTNIIELTAPSLLLHPQRERVIELIEAGRFEMRRMEPSPDTDPDAFTLDDAHVQAFVTEDDGEIIPIATFPVTALGHYIDVPDDPSSLHPSGD